MWRQVSELDMHEGIKFIVAGYDAVDTERKLALFTTNGKTRNQRKWFINRYRDNGNIDLSEGKIVFRESTLKDALLHLETPKMQRRIDLKFGRVR